LQTYSLNDIIIIVIKKFLININGEIYLINYQYFYLFANKFILVIKLCDFII